MRTSPRKATALLLLAALPLSGCSTWRSRGVPAPGGTPELPDPARVHPADGGVVLLHGAEVRGDSLVGYTAEHESGTRVALPLAEVERIDARTFDPVGTVGAVVLAGGVAAVALVAAFFASSPDF